MTRVTRRCANTAASRLGCHLTLRAITPPPPSPPVGPEPTRAAIVGGAAAADYRTARQLSMSCRARCRRADPCCWPPSYASDHRSRQVRIRHIFRSRVHSVRSGGFPQVFRTRVRLNQKLENFAFLPLEATILTREEK